MKIKKINLFFYMAFVLTSIFGCSAGGQNAGSDSVSFGSDVVSNINGDYGTGRFNVNEGVNFIPQGNPLFNIRNSSDPAICVYRQPTINKDVLMMVTSSDLENVDSPDVNGNYYPMNTTYLYTTSNLDGKWYDHGDVLHENDLSTDKGGWSKPNINNLWAPDIQYVPGSTVGNGKFYLYVPTIDGKETYIDPNGKVETLQRIGIAIANEDATTYTPANSPPDYSYGLCKKFIPQKNYFVIRPNGYTLPNHGYAYDPGVFYDDYNKNYYMSYCDGEKMYTDPVPGGRTDGRIHIAKMPKGDMTQADYKGQIKFKNNPTVKDPLGNVYNLNTDIYMEGPDICSYTVSNKEYYYLAFAAKVPNTGTERIGYAIATPDDFNTDPAGCWNFKGWIMAKVNGQSDEDLHWTNHADLGTFNGKFYIFYHKIVKDPEKFPKSINRQVCIDELTVNPINGEIIIPIIGSSDGDGTSNGPFVQRLQNDQTGRYLTVTSSGDDPAAACQTSHSDWTSQQWTGISTGMTVTLISNKWSGLFLATTGTGDYAAVECHVGSTVGDEYKKQTWVPNRNSDGTYSYKNSFSGNYLTCTGTYEGATAACQPLHKDSSGNPDWTSQKWTLNGNRLNNVWSGKDLTCTGKYGATVKAQPLDESWGSQKWVVETILGSDGGYSMNLRNFWSGKYLFEYNGTAICHTEGTLPNYGWVRTQTYYAPYPSPDISIWLMNSKAGTYLGVTNASGNDDYANVECQSKTSLNGPIWHFK